MVKRDSHHRDQSRTLLLQQCDWSRDKKIEEYVWTDISNNNELQASDHGILTRQFTEYDFYCAT